MKIKTVFWILLGFCFISGALALLTRAVDYFRIFYLLIIFQFICYFWTIFSGRIIELERTSQINRQYVGKKFEENYEIINSSRCPILWMEIRDYSDISKSKNRSHILTQLKGNSTRRYQVKYTLQRRGEFRLGPTHIFTGDPFGLFEKITKIESQKKILVLPFELPKWDLEFAGGNLSGGRAIKSAANVISPYVSSIRDYEPGDSYNRIDWKSTAHRDRLMAKEFDQDPQTNSWIYLDGDISEELKREDLKNNERFDFFESSFEFSVCITLAICKSLLTKGNTIGLICNEIPLNILPPDKGERQFYNVLETLSFTKCTSTIGISGIVLSQMQAYSKGNTVFIVTASAKPELEILLESMERRGINVQLVLVSREYFGGSGSKELFEKLNKKNANIFLKEP